ncbi:hypothetical protein ACLB2K_066171 [Fragaria x ananassa]
MITPEAKNQFKSVLSKVNFRKGIQHPKNEHLFFSRKSSVRQSHHVIPATLKSEADTWHSLFHVIVAENTTKISGSSPAAPFPLLANNPHHHLKDTGNIMNACAQLKDLQLR